MKTTLNQTLKTTVLNPTLIDVTQACTSNRYPQDRQSVKYLCKFVPKSGRNINDIAMHKGLANPLSGSAEQPHHGAAKSIGSPHGLKTRTEAFSGSC
jgi:hypothetical protein